MDGIKNIFRNPHGGTASQESSPSTHSNSPDTQAPRMREGGRYTITPSTSTSSPSSASTFPKPSPQPRAPTPATLKPGPSRRTQLGTTQQLPQSTRPRGSTDPSGYSNLYSFNVPPSISLRRHSPTKTSSNSSDPPFNEKPQQRSSDPYAGIATTHYPTEPPEQNSGPFRRVQLGLRSMTSSRSGNRTPTPTNFHGHNYDARMVDVLDTIDPEVQTLTSLTNVQNSLFIPDLGRYVNRRPTYSLTSLLTNESANSHGRFSAASPPEQPVIQRPEPARRVASVTSINSELSDSRYAVLPPNTSLDGWSKEDLSELNDHVRHMLHSRRSKFKRAMKGFGQYVSRPLGFLVTLYATLITLFGLAWVLFLIGWINVGGKQLYVINVIDYVLVALFAIVGDGLAPFRAVDTYRMIYIARYHRLTRRIRKERYLPELQDHNDLPTKMPPPLRKRAKKRSVFFMQKLNKFNPLRRGKQEKDVEEPYEEYSVLKSKQQERLMHHQEKFSKSHTFYKPHETETHFAFPWRLLVAIVILLDFHSMLQISLGAVTWGIDYHHRPFVLTTVILCCSITCNATAGILILIGDRRTRKKDVLERMNRQELTQEAIDLMEKKWEKEEKKKSSTP